jgi:hypothetical protein
VATTTTSALSAAALSLKTAPVVRASSFALSAFLPVTTSVCPALEICVARAEPMLPEPIIVIFICLSDWLLCRGTGVRPVTMDVFQQLLDVNKPPEYFAERGFLLSLANDRAAHFPSCVCSLDHARFARAASTVMAADRNTFT